MSLITNLSSSIPQDHNEIPDDKVGFIVGKMYFTLTKDQIKGSATRRNLYEALAKIYSEVSETNASESQLVLTSTSTGELIKGKNQRKKVREARLVTLSLKSEKKKFSLKGVAMAVRAFFKKPTPPVVETKKTPSFKSVARGVLFSRLVMFNK